MALLGRSFAVVAPSVPEEIESGADPEASVRRLAADKAQAVSRLQPTALVAAADTVVELDGAILGKPTGEAEAIAMLIALRRRWHTVWTGVALALPAGAGLVLRSARTDVRMRAYTEAEAAAYVATGDALDKAAAYAIQDAAFGPVAEIRGCYANVMGLPLCLLHRMMHEVGQVEADPLTSCTAFLRIACGGDVGSGERPAGGAHKPVPVDTAGSDEEV